MKKSKYNYIVKHKNRFLIFNVLLNTCVIIDEKTYDDFKNLTPKDEDKENFLRLGMMVDDDVNETDVVFFNNRLANENSRLNFYRIYTTTYCNAKCPYCYERNCKRETMNLETAKNVCEFIKKTHKKGNDVMIEWFGGEPLLNTKIIDFISDEIKSFTQSENVKFSSRLITNGLLLNEQNITKAKNNWNLGRVQITLDGTKEIYENIKNFKMKDAFEVVISNIRVLINRNIKVNIRLNYNDENFNNICDLIKILGENFKNTSLISVYTRKIMTETGDNSFQSSAKTDIFLYKKLIENSLVDLENIVRTIPRRSNVCIAHMINSFMISPSGKLGKCSQAFEKENVGDINKINQNALIKWCCPQISKKCLRCKLLPVCNGGCLYEKFANKNYCYYSEEMLNFKLKTFLKYYVNKNFNS